MDGLSAAASVIAVLQITKEVGSLCYEYSKGVKNATSDIEQLHGELKLLESHLDNTRELLKKKDANGHELRATQALQDELKNCTLELKSVEAELVKRKAKSKRGLGALVGVSLKWPFKKKEVDVIVGKLAKFRGTISASLVVDTAGLTLEGFTRIDQKEQVEILNWISPIQYGDHHDAIRQRRTADTCEWLLQHEKFKEWESAASSTVIWVHGSPGAGKTYLASKTIDHFRNRTKRPATNEGFAFFYCNRNEDERRKPLSVLQSYVRQLASPLACPKDMRKMLRDLWLEKRQNGLTLNEDDCKKQILESVDMYSRTTLVLDALDECEPQSQRQILITLDYLMSTSTKPLSVFISSRPDRLISKKLFTKANIEISATDNHTDIETFVNEEIVKHADWEDLSPSLKSDVSAVLLTLSRGMFQWAYLQIKQLLELTREDTIRERLGKLPRDLDAAYDEIFDRIGQQHNFDKALAESALKWVMCAEHPLSHEELLSAIRIDSSTSASDAAAQITTQDLTHFCQHFLRYDTQIKAWRVSHLSVVEYLEKHHWSPADAHGHAAMACLKLLNDPNYASEIPKEEGLKEFACYLDELDIYANRHWIFHVEAYENLLEKGSFNANPTLVQSLMRFIGSLDESSFSYRRWHDVITQPHRVDFWETSLEPLNTEDISPSNTAVHLLCHFSIYLLLREWWDEKSITISSQNNDKTHSPLISASAGGSIHICRALIARGHPVDPTPAELCQRDANYFLGTEGARRYARRAYLAALTAAAEKGHVDIVQLLIDNGAKVNLTLPTTSGILGSLEYDSALAAAASAGRTQALHRLIDLGANVHLPLPRNGSALEAACRHGQLAAARALLDNNADPNQLSTTEEGSPLAAAAISSEGEDRSLVKLLLDHGADVNLLSPGGEYGSALIASVVFKYWPSMMEYLVEKGADVNLCAHVGVWGTPLIAAAWGASHEFVAYLVAQGADVTAKVSVGYFGTAAVAAGASEFWDSRKLKTLVARGADLNCLSPTGLYGSALVAVMITQVKAERCATEALDLGADPNLAVATGCFGSALIAAALRVEVEGAKVLISRGADVGVIAETGDFGTALISAAVGGKVAMVQLLLNHGAEVNEVVSSGLFGNALCAASLFGWTKCVQILLEAGADVNLRTNQSAYGTALEAARAELSLDFLIERDWWMATMSREFIRPTWQYCREEVDDETGALLGTWDELAARKTEVADLLRSHGAVDD